MGVSAAWRSAVLTSPHSLVPLVSAATRPTGRVGPSAAVTTAVAAATSVAEGAATQHSPPHRPSPRYDDEIHNVEAV